MRKSTKIVVASLAGVALASLGSLAWLMSVKQEAEPPLSSLRGVSPYIQHTNGYVVRVGLARDASALYHVRKPLAQAIAEADRELGGKGWRKGSPSPNFAAYYSRPAPPGVKMGTGGAIAFFAGRKDWGARPVPGAGSPSEWTTIRVSGATRRMTLIDRMRAWVTGQR